LSRAHGFSLGRGSEIALTCDIRISSEHTVFALPETGLGVITRVGGSQQLPRDRGRAGARHDLHRQRIQASRA
jgi:enoyl-CoA hydratase